MKSYHFLQEDQQCPNISMLYYYYYYYYYYYLCIACLLGKLNSVRLRLTVNEPLEFNFK